MWVPGTMLNVSTYSEWAAAADVAGEVSQEEAKQGVKEQGKRQGGSR